MAFENPIRDARIGRSTLVAGLKLVDAAHDLYQSVAHTAGLVDRGSRWVSGIANFLIDGWSICFSNRRPEMRMIENALEESAI